MPYVDFTHILESQNSLLCHNFWELTFWNIPFSSKNIFILLKAKHLLHEHLNTKALLLLQGNLQF